MASASPTCSRAMLARRAAKPSPVPTGKTICLTTLRDRASYRAGSTCRLHFDEGAHHGEESPQSRTRSPPRRSREETARKAKRKAAPKARPRAAAEGAAIPGFRPKMLAGMGDMSKMAKMMTPAQAMDLYKANAKMALDVINAAIENTTRLRRLQFEGEEQARAMGRKAHEARRRGRQPQRDDGGRARAASQEAMEHAMRYWGQMFEMIVEMQKRLFVMMEDQMAGVPGVKEAKAAMSMMPDMRRRRTSSRRCRASISSGGNRVRVDAEGHGRLRADGARHAPAVARFRPRRCLCQQVGQRRAQPRRGDRLVQQHEAGGLQARELLRRTLARHDDRRHAGAEPPRVPARSPSMPSRRSGSRKSTEHRVGRQCAAQLRDRVVGVGGYHRHATPRGQRLPHAFANRLVVVDDQHAAAVQRIRRRPRDRRGGTWSIGTAVASTRNTEPRPDARVDVDLVAQQRRRAAARSRGRDPGPGARSRSGLPIW